MQWLEEMLGEEGGREQKMMELQLGPIEKREEEANKKKISALIKEYREFKEKNVQHFRFNASANSSTYGKFSHYPAYFLIHKGKHSREEEKKKHLDLGIFLTFIKKQKK